MFLLDCRHLWLGLRKRTLGAKACGEATSAVSTCHDVIWQLLTPGNQQRVVPQCMTQIKNHRRLRVLVKQYLVRLIKIATTDETQVHSKKSGRCAECNLVGIPLRPENCLQVFLPILRCLAVLDFVNVLLGGLLVGCLRINHINMEIRLKRSLMLFNVRGNPRPQSSALLRKDLLDLLE